MLIDLSTDDKDYVSIVEEMQSTIREHKDCGSAGGVFKTYNIIKVSLHLTLLSIRSCRGYKLDSSPCY